MKRILIVEDEKNIADVERDYLEIEGLSVTVENNGRKGLMKAEE